MVCFCVTAFQGNVSEQSFHLKEKTLQRDLMETGSPFQFPHSDESHSFTNQTVNLNWHPNVLRQGIILSVRGEWIALSNTIYMCSGSQMLTDLTFSAILINQYTVSRFNIGTQYILLVIHELITCSSLIVVSSLIHVEHGCQCVALEREINYS